MPSGSPGGCVLFGGLIESFKLPPHEAVRRECNAKELSFAPLLYMLLMLPNLCMAALEDEGVGEWNESLGGEEGFS